jgi:hypothetical protein
MTTVTNSTETLSGASSANPLKRIKGFLENKEQADYEKGLATWVNSEYQKCKSARIGVERQWYENLEMYGGNHWVVWGRGSLSGKLLTPAAPPWRTRLTINRIKPIVRTEISRLTSQKPNASVVPASSEDEDLFAAQAGEQVWESTYSRKKVNTVLRRSAWWLCLTGVGYIKAYWDASKVDRMADMQGDFCIENITPFHIFVPDLTLEEIEDQPYVIHAQVMAISKLQLMYPDLGFNPTVVAQSEIIDNARLKIDVNSQPDSCLALEMWIKPGTHKDFPQGGMIRVIDNHVVELVQDGIPYQHGEYPFVKFEHIPTGKYYAESVIVDLAKLQREYNRTRSQIIESKNRMAKLQLVAPEGSVDPSKMTTEPGQVILYKPGFAPPQPLPVQGLPAYVMQELERILMDMEDISSQHQVSKGNVPPGVTAATAISYLQEKDDSVLSHTYSSVEEGMEKLARQVLTLAVQFWNVPRVIKVTGTDGAFDALAFKGSDLEHATDIRIEGGSALPQSKAARQAFIMDMMKMGFIDPNKGLEMMEIGGVQKLYEQLRVDERQAQRENLRMKSFDPEQIAQHYQMLDQLQMMQEGMQQQIDMQTAALPQDPEGMAMFAPDGSPESMQGNLGMAGANPEDVMSQMPGMESDMQTGEMLMPPPLVPVNTWDNHAVHIDVHNRYRKSQSFELLSEEEHVSTHAQALNQSAMAAQMPGGLPPDMGGGEGESMGVPPLSQGDGGQIPPELQQMMEG